MAKQTVNIGTVVNDGTGDNLRVSMDKINDNFDELYLFANSEGLTGQTATLSTNTFTLGTSSIAANGYNWLPNDVLEQWVTVSSNTTVGDITFPIGLTTVLGITYNAMNITTYDITYQPLLLASNTTTANIRTANATAVNIFVKIIGV